MEVGCRFCVVIEPKPHMSCNRIYNSDMLRYALPFLLVILCAAQEPSFRTGINLVTVTCTVSGPDGQPVSDLHLEDFQIVDDGRLRQPQYLWRESDLPFTLGLVADVSGSQTGVTDEHRQALTRFIHQVFRQQDQ